MAVSSILGQYEAQQTANENKVEGDKEMFLKLLVAQLSNQDPLNPVEDKEFIAQLAQFTSLEELQNINSSVQQVVQSTEQGQLVNATNLVGKRVLSDGYTVTKYSALDENGDTVAVVQPLIYRSDVELSECKVVVTESGSTNIVFYESLGPKLAGEDVYNWDAKNVFGITVPDGKYDISVTGIDTEGNNVILDHEIFGDVIGVERIDGEMYLTLSDLRQVKFTDVQMVSMIASSSGGTGSETDPETSTD